MYTLTIEDTQKISGGANNDATSEQNSGWAIIIPGYVGAATTMMSVALMSGTKFNMPLVVLSALVPLMVYSGSLLGIYTYGFASYYMGTNSTPPDKG